MSLVTILATVVSCVAAVVVVPEVRCILGLSTGEAECARRNPSDLSSSFLPTDGTRRIHARFEQVEADIAAARYDSVRKDLSVPADSAYLTIYVDGRDVPKVRARIFNGGGRTVWQAYYQGGQLVFVYRTDSRAIPGSGWSDSRQERYYFTDGSMTRWLSGMQKRPISVRSAKYVDAEQQVRSLGARMLESARSPDSVVAF